MKLLVTRPSAQSIRTATRLREAGHEAVVSPLLQIVPIAWAAADQGPDLILLTSANAVLSPVPDHLLNVPALAMGSASAAAARGAGFTAVEAADARGAADLYRLAAKRGVGRALHLCGRDLTVAEEPAGLEIERIVTYRADLIPLSAEATAALIAAQIDIVLTYSARTLRQFEREIRRVDVPKDRIAIAHLGKWPDEKAPLGWKHAVRATEPTEEALLDAAFSLPSRGGAA